MKTTLLLFALLLLQTDFSNSHYLEQLDFSEDGKLMVGINRDCIILMDTKTLNILDKYTFSGNYSPNPNIRISGNGKHLICARGRKFYYAKIHRNKIKKLIIYTCL